MHDAIGIAGMLRGWVNIWTVQMVWPLLALAGSLGATAIAEALMNARGRPKHHTQQPLVTVAGVPGRAPPLG